MKLSLCLVIHNHQPVGNLHEALEQAVTRTYQPLLEVIEQHPGVSLSLHYSSALLEYFEQHHPGLLETIRTLVKRKQVELLGGAAFEPLLPLIPPQDTLGQLRHQTDHLQRLFKFNPRGAWLPEFAWEPTFPVLLSEAGLEFTLLDDTQLIGAGMPAPDLNAPVLTEHHGQHVKIVPVSAALRRQLPFMTVKELMRTLEEQRLEAFTEAKSTVSNGVLVTVALDAETFNNAAPRAEWLDDALGALEDAEDWLTTRTLSQALETHPASTRAYVPSSGSRQLALWTTKPETARKLERVQIAPELEPFVRGGSWRAFLTKYPEADHLLKRANRVSRKLHNTARVPEEAYLHLWRAQTGVPYWHGQQGGVYQNYLRSAAYSHLICAENLIEPRKYGWLEIEYDEQPGNGVADIIAESHTMNVYFSPAVGGMITELDDRRKAFNLIDTFTRQPEFDHPPGLVTDPHPRRALIDHFIGAESELSEFVAGTYLELGDFTNGRFEASKYRDRVTLIRDGFVRGPVGEPVPVEIKKAVQIIPKESRLEVEYRITNKGRVDIITRFGSEWGFGLLDDRSSQRYLTVNGSRAGKLGDTREHRNVQHASLMDEWLGLGIVFDFDGRDVLLWHHPIHSTEKIADTLERRYQSTVMLPLWDLDLPMGRSRRITYSLQLLEQ